MTKLVFGNTPADMLEPEFFGYAPYFPSDELELVSAGVNVILERDPVTGSTVELRGAFDLSSEAALLASRVDEMLARTAPGELLVDWSAMSTTIAEFLGLIWVGPEGVNAYLLRGDDQIQGGSGDDVLRGYGGANRLDGGAGNDTAAFTAAASGFTAGRKGMTYFVTDKSHTEGSNELVATERLQFADKTFGLVNPPGPTPPVYAMHRDFLFDAVFYLLDNPELVPTISIETAAQHYFATGAAQGKAPNSWFDPTWYENRWPDLTPYQFDDATLFLHYNLHGVWEGRAAGAEFDQFDGNRYLADNPDVAAYVDSHLPDFLGSRSNGAIAHLVIYGQHELRPAFDLVGQPIDLGYTVDLGG
jgi:hypothetical protein